MEVPDNIQIQSPLPPLDNSLLKIEQISCKNKDVQLAELLNAPGHDISLFSMDECTLDAGLDNYH
jgi:hypothetical protein